MFRPWHGKLAIPPLRFAVPSTQFPTLESPASSLPPSYIDIQSTFEMEIECWDAKTGAGPFFGPFFGPAKKGHLVLAFKSQDDGKKTLLMVRSEVRGEQGN
jgi:hypothetical protein